MPELRTKAEFGRDARFPRARPGLANMALGQPSDIPCLLADNLNGAILNIPAYRLH